MDRLARNLDDLRRLVRTMTDQGVRVEFVKESLTFTYGPEALDRQRSAPLRLRVRWRHRAGNLLDNLAGIRARSS